MSRARTLDRWRFERRFRELCHERGTHQGGHATAYGYRLALESRWTAYTGATRCLKRSRGSFRTTNGQRAQQLAKDGSARSPRTVQRIHRDLEAMGLLRVDHVKRSGAARRPGELDCLAIYSLLPSRVTPRFAECQQKRGPLQGPLSAAGTQTSKTEIPPAAPADVGPAPPAGTAGNEEEADHVSPPQDVDPIGCLEAEIRFAELKLATGWGPRERVEQRLGHLRAQARQLRASLPQPRTDSDGRNSAQ